MPGALRRPEPLSRQARVASQWPGQGGDLSLGLQIAQSRPSLYTLGPKVGIIYLHGAPGFEGI